MKPFAVAGRRRRGPAARGLPLHAAPRRTAAASIAPSSSRGAAIYAGAAAVYERLAAETTGSDSAEFLLRAARAWFSRPAARRTPIACSRCCPPALTQQQTLEQKLLRIQSAVAQGRGDEAWRDISAMQTPTAPAAAARYYETRQQVAIATGPPRGRHPRRARARAAHRARAKSRQRAHRVVRPAARRRRTRRRRSTPPPGSDATVRGWLEAASVAADNARNPTLGATRLARLPRALSRRTRRCAALAGEPGVGIEAPAAKLEAAPHVALMLPLSGRTSAPAAQIRDGFMTAYYQLPANARPRLRVYDTATARHRRHHRRGHAPPARNSSSAR